jgi:DNA-binding NarL/FixJ family response regulator
MPDDPLLKLLMEEWDLTARQAVVVALLAQGLAVKEVATKLNRSQHTIHEHMTKVYEVTGPHDHRLLTTAVHALMQEHGIKIQKPAI